jgi:hypothetical protein
MQLGQPCFGHRWDLTEARARVRKLIEERERTARHAGYMKAVGHIDEPAIRREALEEAATVCDQRADYLGGFMGGEDRATTYRWAARHIRALLADQPEGWDGACGACMVCEPGDCLHDQPPASGTQGEK